ncbi:MAG: hypothetical protein RLZZ387_5579 [Chloroflexota bacterium]|jgi:uncharacterized protein with von Willebrand factor type A (vWA) domain
MNERVVQFITALRAQGVRISVAESIDALRAAEVAGVGDRGIFRSALRATLVKEPHDLPTFDKLFPSYFGSEAPPPMQQPGGGMSPEDQEKLLEQLLEMMEGMTPEQLRQLFEAMMTGQGMSSRQMREFLDQNTSMSQMPASAPGAWAVRRALRELEFDRLEELLQELLEKLREAGFSEEQLQQLAEEARENQQALGQQIAREVGSGMAEREAEEQRKQPPGEDLLDRPFEYMGEQDLDDIRKVIQRLAAQLRTRVALRQKRASKGTLDAKGTIRANLRYGAVPVEIRHRRKHLKPRLTVVCDVSGSVERASRFMLLLVYALQDQISRTRPFVYYRTLADVRSDFEELRPEEAVQVVRSRVQGGPWQTSLGACLGTLVKDHMDAVDQRTTVIFLGDGDDHMGPPNTQDFEAIKRRAHKVVWFNPEQRWQWQREDNHMHVYGPLCDGVHVVSNLRELLAAVDGLFAYR